MTRKSTVRKPGNGPDVHEMCTNGAIRVCQNSKTLRKIGAPGTTRTCDLRFRKPLLYPLSYGGGDGPKRGPKFGHSALGYRPLRLAGKLVSSKSDHRPANT